MGPSILIVDDEFGLAEMLREMLMEVGYQVAVAIHGRGALQVLRDRRVDLVLTDIMMPVMDGPELARTIRADPSLRTIPIVMMTSLPSAVPAEPGLYEGVLRKPFEPGMLLVIIEACLQGRDNLEH